MKQFGGILLIVVSLVGLMYYGNYFTWKTYFFCLYGLVVGRLFVDLYIILWVSDWDEDTGAAVQQSQQQYGSLLAAMLITGRIYTVMDLVLDWRNRCFQFYWVLLFAIPLSLLLLLPLVLNMVLTVLWTLIYLGRIQLAVWVGWELILSGWFDEPDPWFVPQQLALALVYRWGRVILGSQISSTPLTFGRTCQLIYEMGGIRLLTVLSPVGFQPIAKTFHLLVVTIKAVRRQAVLKSWRGRIHVCFTNLIAAAPRIIYQNQIIPDNFNRCKLKVQNGQIIFNPPKRGVLRRLIVGIQEKYQLNCRLEEGVVAHQTKPNHPTQQPPSNTVVTTTSGGGGPFAPRFTYLWRPPLFAIRPSN